MAPMIVFNSPELACFHEAGHAETALGVGARIVEIKLCRQQPRSYGRTRVDRNEDQRRHIALGGFAAEYLLFKAERLVKPDGVPPTEKEFIDLAMDNAIEDRISFFGQDYPGSDAWPRELDDKFISFAIGRAENEMRFELVERISSTTPAMSSSKRMSEFDGDFN